MDEERRLSGGQYVAFIILALIISIDEAGSIKETQLVTRIGILTGITDYAQLGGERKFVTRFLGIPYAKPPIFERRFSRPEPYGHLEQKYAYNATFHRPHCIQLSTSYVYITYFTQSEDCLYLNIYLPGISGPQTNGNISNYPVMVYIHGGSFAVGGADVYGGEELSAFNDVIVVTINYRLNVFGFLSDGGTDSGNYGLWDMKLAIQWVHDNINSFGGDPSKVTIFGNSAGGAAVQYQAMNPANRGLFQRVISQSGSCFAFWALQTEPAHNLKWYASRVGCYNGNYSVVLKCLRKQSVSSLTLDHSKYIFKFVPSVDQDFLLEDPTSLSERKSHAGKAAMDFFSELDFVNGVLSQDGAYSSYLWSPINVTGVSRGHFLKTYVPTTLVRLYNTIPPALEQSAIHQYTDWTNQHDPLVVRNKLVDFESDITFFVPAVHASKTHQVLRERNSSKTKDSFFYVFDHKPGFAPEPAWLTGATHVMELPYVFGFTKGLQFKLMQDYHAIDPFMFTDEDTRFSKLLMTYWTNFAKTG